MTLLKKEVYTRLRRLKHEQLIDSVRLGFPDSRVKRFFLTEEGQTDLQGRRRYLEPARVSDPAAQADPSRPVALPRRCGHHRPGPVRQLSVGGWRIL